VVVLQQEFLQLVELPTEILIGRFLVAVEVEVELF
jgi:hypothetical protein